ncbi:MAG: lipopolysaccharide biosynthesis protein RfbH [bacterium]|nr:lipopolysaccharide biosynthesis protein RfbH [bacterium]MDT8365188.1 lipopolysaccharide biosynthesis protein RfbH [bacterium]
MKKTGGDHNIRDQIQNLVRAYYQETFEGKEFVPGKTRIPYAGRVFDDAELVTLVDAALEFWLTQGRYSDSFEKNFGKFMGLSNCCFVNSGSSANLLAFMALTSPGLGAKAIERGDEVITVAAAFPTTVTPVMQYGAIPVFIDVELSTCNADTRFLEEALSPRTRAVMLAHTLGNPFDLDTVTEFCRKHDLWLIEDNCDALGSRYKDQMTGTFGDIGTSSFYPPHHMTTGEGGAVYTDNSELAGILISLRDWGRDCICPSGIDDTCGRRFSGQYGSLPPGYDHKYVYSQFGYNLKATDLQAAIGVAQLEKLPTFIERRRENWQLMRDGLSDLGHYLILPEPAPGSLPSWFGFLMLVRQEAPFSRDEIVAHLESRGIQTRMLFAGNFLHQPCFDHIRSSSDSYRVVGDLVATDEIMRSAFWVGVYPGISTAMAGYMVDSILEFAQK